MNEITSIFKATHGVMTEEVGVISGELELTTACQEDGSLTLPSRMSGQKMYTRSPAVPISFMTRTIILSSIRCS